jgi:hypothetical protein
MGFKATIPAFKRTKTAIVIGEAISQLSQMSARRGPQLRPGKHLSFFNIYQEIVSYTFT